MRRRGWTAWALATLGLALAAAARALPDTRPVNVVAGLLLIAAIVVGLSLLRVWRRWLVPLVPLSDLFGRPLESERWCTRCGHPTRRKGPCRACGHTPASRGS